MASTGNFTATIPEGDKGQGAFILRVAYEDQGAYRLPSLRPEQILVMRNAKLNAHAFDRLAKKAEDILEGLLANFEAIAKRIKE